MEFDDPSLNRPALVNWTPADMYDARHYVAAVTSTPFDLVTETEVWAYRIGYSNPSQQRDWEQVNEMSARDRELDAIAPVHVDPEDHPAEDMRGVSSDELFYGRKDDDDKSF